MAELGARVAREIGEPARQQVPVARWAVTGQALGGADLDNGVERAAEPRLEHSSREARGLVTLGF
jgi:hypothetical protein